MVTRPTSTSKKSDNKAIYEILLKILDKWSVVSSSSEDTISEDSPQIAVEDKKVGADSLNEEIVTETVLLRPEDFQADSPDQTAGDDDSTVSEPGYIKPQMTEEDSARRTIEQDEEDVPKTIIQDLEYLKAEEPSPDSREMEIPETVIFSTQEKTSSSLQPDETTSEKYKPEKQEPLKTANESRNNNESSDKDDINETIPETIIFNGNIDDDKR